MKLLKKGAAIMISLIMVAGSLFMQVVPASAETDWGMNIRDLEMRVGQQVQLVFTGPNGDVQTGGFSSENPDVVTVDANGLVTAVGPGQTLIDYYSEIDDASDVCSVTVLGMNYERYNFSLADNMNPLQLELLDADLNQISGTFTSDDESVATVGERSGVVVPVGLGSCSIYYESDEGGISCSCWINVLEKYSLSKHEIYEKGNTYTSIYYTGPEDYMMTNGIWSVDNEEVCRYEEGYIETLNPGTAILTYTTPDGKYSDTCTVHVYRGFEIRDISLVLGNGPFEDKLEFRGLDDVVVQGEYFSADENVATVDSEGYVTPVGTGSTTIYFSAYDEERGISYDDYCNVEVVEPYRLSIGNKMTCSLGSDTYVEFYGPDGEPLRNDEFTVSSDHPEVVCYENGYIHPVSVGEARITFTTLEDEPHSAYCDITVVNGLERKDILFKDLENYEPVKIVFHGVNDSVIEADSTYVDNPNVARVDNNGYIHPVGVGYAYVYFYGHDDSHDYYEACFVKVTKAYSLSMTSMVTTRNSGYGIEFYGAEGELLSEDVFIWESSNPDVAYYENGTIFGGEQTGEADVTFYTLDRQHQDTCHVTVIRGLEPREIEFIYGEEYEPVPVAFYGINDEIISGNYSIEDESVATFDENGCVIPVGLGNTWLYFSNYENGNSYSDSIPITVRNAYYLSDYEIILSPRTARSIHFYGPDGEDLDFSEYSVNVENPEVARFDNDFGEHGSINFVGIGETDVTFTANNGFSQTCHVYCVRGLEPQVISFNISGENNNPIPLVFYGIGDEIVNGGSYSSEDTSIADVDEAGNVYPVGPGRTAIHFDYGDKQHYYFGFCEVTVTKAYTLDRHELFLSIVDLAYVVFYGADGEELSDDEFTVESSDPTVACYENGLIRAVGSGTAWLTFTANGTDISDTCKVIVYEGLNYRDLKLTVGSEEGPVQLTFTGPEGYDSSGYFESEDTHIATVDENGYVTPVSAGNIYIDYYSYNGNFYDSCYVEVLDSTVLNHLTEHEITFDGIDEYEFLAFLDENGNSTTDGTWISSDETVATVEDGTITAVGYGSAVITYTSPKGIVDTCTVTVYGLNHTDLEFWLGGNMAPVTLFYQDMQGQRLSGTWTSDNEEVATVDANGVVTPVGKGYAVITFTYESDGHSIAGKCYVSVREATYQLFTHEMWVPVGRTSERLSFNGENGSTKEGTWSSSDENAVTVDQNGNVTGITVGASATVHYISPDGQHEDDCLVTVIKGLDRRSMTLTLGGESGQLTYTNHYWTPTYGYMWQSTNESVVTVKGGLVTPVGVGTAKVWVQTLDNPFDYDWCDVNVVSTSVDQLNMHHVDVMLHSSFNELRYIDETGEETTEGTWTSSDTTVAKVGSDGSIYGVGVGTAVIQYRNTAGVLKDTCTVTVYQGLNTDRLELWYGGENKPAHLEFIGPEGIVEGTFTSYNPYVAAVSSDGTVTPKGVGSTNIEFISNDGKYSGICAVGVGAAYQLTRETADTIVGQGISIFFYGDNGEKLEDFEWYSSHSDVAVYNPETHTIDGLSVGTSEFTFTYRTDEGEIYSDTCLVYVHPGLNYQDEELYVGDTLQLVFKMMDGTVVEGHYQAGPSSVITVDQNGVITAVGPGTGYVNFFADNGLMDSCKITVREKTAEYRLNFDELRISLGIKRTCLYMMGPDGMEADGVWESSNPEVANVWLDSGRNMATIEAYSLGTTTITYTSHDRVHKATCEVTVVPGLNYKELTLAMGDEGIQLTYTGISGEPSTNAFSWRSNNTDVVTVENGYVTPVGVGTAVIECVWGDPNIDYDYCRITVVDHMPTYELNITYLDIPVYKEGISTGTAQLQLIGDDGSIGTAEWFSSNESVATVDQSGLVHAYKYGKATISAVLPSGQAFECEVQTRFWDAYDPGAYYFNAIYWAADHNPMITRGYNLEYFGVGMNCTRKDFMLFLYRMAGQPTVSTAGLTKTFKDVSGLSSSFLKAIAWGVNKGITKGYKDGTFQPEAPITRKDAMIMLYRYYGKPNPKDYKKISTFTDCKTLNKTSDTYKAIAWAASYGITNGYSTDVPGYEYKAPCFGNSLNILREQMITFMYRAVGKFGEKPR